jgi:hypothetical protein
MTQTNKDYLASKAPEWNYPPLDPPAPKGTKLNLLTIGGVAVLGNWQDDQGYVAWAPLIKRNPIKEQLLKDMQNANA